MHSNIYTFFIVRIFDQNLEKKVCARKIHGFLCHANLVDFQKKRCARKKHAHFFLPGIFLHAEFCSVLYVTQNRIFCRKCIGVTGEWI